MMRRSIESDLRAALAAAGREPSGFVAGQAGASDHQWGPEGDQASLLPLHLAWRNIVPTFDPIQVSP